MINKAGNHGECDADVPDSLIVRMEQDAAAIR